MSVKIINKRIVSAFQDLLVGEAFMYGLLPHIKIRPDLITTPNPALGFAIVMGTYHWKVQAFIGNDPVKKIRAEIKAEGLDEICEEWEIDEGDSFMYGTDPCVKLWHSAYVNELTDIAINLNTWQLVKLADDELFQKADIEIILGDESI